MREIYFFILFLLRIPFFKIRKNVFGKNVRLEPNVFLARSRIGNYCYVGHNTIIDKAIIGNYCSIAASVMIGGAEHPLEKASTSFRIYPATAKKFTILEDDVWVGAKATIKQGVRIGRGAVVGSHALVLENVPPYAIVVGTPAKIIRMRFTPKEIETIEATRYWELLPKEARKILDKIIV